MIVRAAPHNVCHAKSVNIKLCYLFHNFLVDGQVNRNGPCGHFIAFSGRSRRSVILRGGIGEPLKLYRTGGGISAVLIGFESGGKRPFLYILNHQAVYFGQGCGSAGSSQQTDRIGSRHVSSSFLSVKKSPCQPWRLSPPASYPVLPRRLFQAPSVFLRPSTPGVVL